MIKYLPEQHKGDEKYPAELVYNERRILDLALNLDEHGQIDNSKQGQHLLFEIEKSLASKNVLQKDMKSVDDLLRVGESVLLDFDDMLLNIASELNASVLLPGLKKEDRIQAKIDYDYEGNANAVKDVVRGSILGL